MIAAPLIVSLAGSLAALLAQAEPAPAPASAPPPLLPPSAAALATPDNALSVHARFAYRLGNEGSRLGPAAGFSLGGSFERRYLVAPDGRFELGAAVDFFYDRFSRGVTGSSMVAPGQEQPFAAQRTLSQTSFALLQTAGLRAGPVRPFVAVGVGLTLAYFNTPEADLRPGTANATQPLGRAVAGVDIAVSHAASLTVRADYTHLWTRPTFVTTAGQSYDLFGDLFDMGLGMLVRF
jgi:hypothetical protein